MRASKGSPHRCANYKTVRTGVHGQASGTTSALEAARIWGLATSGVLSCVACGVGNAHLSTSQKRQSARRICLATRKCVQTYIRRVCTTRLLIVWPGNAPNRPADSRKRAPCNALWRTASRQRTSTLPEQFAGQHVRPYTTCNAAGRNCTRASSSGATRRL